jgi:hypothetical protein
MFLKWLLLWMHPFYVSICDINYNSAKKDAEITVRIFTDDFEQTLQANFPSEKLDLFNPRNQVKTDSLINKYIQSKFNIKINGKPYKINYLGHERVEESIWCYFEIPALETPKNVHISNRILYDYRKEQTNMHNVSVNGQSKSRKIDNPDSEVEFSFSAVR